MIYLILLIVSWNLAPVFLLCSRDIPKKNKILGSISLLWAGAKGLLVLPVELLAPIVVPFALAKTKWEDEKLPHWARWWDNDIGINGDKFVWIEDTPGHGVPQPVPLEDTPEARALCYWAPGHHPRSKWARYVWLGLRNRGSALASSLGVEIKDKTDTEVWGDPLVNRDHAGWCVRRIGSTYQLQIVKQIGKFCIRVNTGHKLDLVMKWDRAVAIVVNVTLSLLTWKGK